MTSASLIASRAWTWTCSSIGVAGRDLEAAGVHDDEPPAVPLGVAVHPVAGRPGPVLDDGGARVAHDPVEQRALADVRAARRRRRRAGRRVRDGHGQRAAPAADGDRRAAARWCGRRAWRRRRGRRRRARRRAPASRASRRWRRSARRPRAGPRPASTCRRSRRRRGRRSNGAGSTRSRAFSIWIAGVPAIWHSRVSSLVFAEWRPPTTTMRSTSRAVSMRVLLPADRDRADGVDDLELVGAARP